MLKVRGEDFISKRVDNVFDQAKLMPTMINERDGFRMVLEQSCTNVCFQYIPPSLRNQTEDEEWEKKIDKVKFWIKFCHISRCVIYNNIFYFYQVLQIITMIFPLGRSKNKGKNDDAGNIDGCISATSFKGTEKFLPDGFSLCTRTNK